MPPMQTTGRRPRIWMPPMQTTGRSEDPAGMVSWRGQIILRLYGLIRQQPLGNWHRHWHRHWDQDWWRRCVLCYVGRSLFGTEWSMTHEWGEHLPDRNTTVRRREELREAAEICVSRNVLRRACTTTRCDASSLVWCGAQETREILVDTAEAAGSVVYSRLRAEPKN